MDVNFFAQDGIMLFLKLFFQAAIIIFAMVGIGQWISKRAENRGPKA